jgi:hypothetical protein
MTTGLNGFDRLKEELVAPQDSGCRDNSKISCSRGIWLFDNLEGRA